MKVIIFGLNDYAQLAAYYLMSGSKYHPVSFCVEPYWFSPGAELMGLPVSKFLQNSELPDAMFIPVRDNVQRRRLYDEAKKAGYTLISYISSRAVVNGKVGDNCFIQELNNIQPFASIGNNCILWAGNHIGHHSIIEDDVTITSHCVISGHCRIGRGSFLGVNCTIRDGVSIAEGTVIGQGANVISNITEPNGIYIGNPAVRRAAK